MNSKLEVGLSYKSEVLVSPSETALAVGSGSLEVFATPCMIALMENAAMKAVEDAVSNEETTVGIHIDAKHLSASPLGRRVHAVATLKEIEGKKLTFWIEAYDEKNKIGEASHARFIVDKAKFMERLK